MYAIHVLMFPVCTDDFAGWLANQTNLALKGIIGVKAMSELADLVGYPSEYEYYKVTSCLTVFSLLLLPVNKKPRTSPPSTSRNGKNTASHAMEPMPKSPTHGTVH